MTYEEALFNLRNATRVEIGYIFNPIKAEEVLETAIEALDKQIPKKKHKYMGYRCVCGNEVAKNQAYCEYCGQRLE